MASSKPRASRGLRTLGARPFNGGPPPRGPVGDAVTPLKRFVVRSPGAGPTLASIPLAKARSAEVFLAHEMNGLPLEAAHGAPLRVVVPGDIGARSVKWLSRIALTRAPSANFFQTRAYKRVPRGPTRADLQRAR